MFPAAERLSLFSVEEMWDKLRVIRESESERCFHVFQILLSIHKIPYDNISFGGCIISHRHKFSPGITFSWTRKPFTFCSWVIKYSLNCRLFDKMGQSFFGSSTYCMYCRGLALSHTIFSSESLSDDCEQAWSLAREHRYCTGAFIDRSHCTRTLWKTVDCSSFTAITSLYLCSDDSQYVKMMGAAAKGGKSCQIGLLNLVCVSECACRF